jgi:hypothetical protein
MERCNEGSGTATHTRSISGINGQMRHGSEAITVTSRLSVVDETAGSIKVEGRGEDRGLDEDYVIRDGFTRGTEEGNGVTVGANTSHKVNFNGVVDRVKQGLGRLDDRDGGHFIFRN